jgi:hypothetical protein
MHTEEKSGAKKGIKRPRTASESTDPATESSIIQCEPSPACEVNKVAPRSAQSGGRPRLLLACPELNKRLGKKYCDESELLPLLIKHGIIRRVWTVEEEVVLSDDQGRVGEEQKRLHALYKVAAWAGGGGNNKVSKTAIADAGDPKVPPQSVSLVTEEGDIRGKWGNSEITLLEMLQAHFHLPIVDASRAFDVCTTRLKKVCRQYGIKRWPHRQVRISLCQPINPHSFLKLFRIFQIQCALKSGKHTLEEVKKMGIQERAKFNVALLPPKPSALYIGANPTEEQSQPAVQQPPLSVCDAFLDAHKLSTEGDKEKAASLGQLKSMKPTMSGKPVTIAPNGMITTGIVANDAGTLALAQTSLQQVESFPVGMYSHHAVGAVNMSSTPFSVQLAMLGQTNPHLQQLAAGLEAGQLDLAQLHAHLQAPHDSSNHATELHPQPQHLPIQLQNHLPPPQAAPALRVPYQSDNNDKTEDSAHSAQHSSSPGAPTVLKNEPVDDSTMSESSADTTSSSAAALLANFENRALAAVPEAQAQATQAPQTAMDSHTQAAHMHAAQAQMPPAPNVAPFQAQLEALVAAHHHHQQQQQQQARVQPATQPLQPPLSNAVIDETRGVPPQPPPLAPPAAPLSTTIGLSNAQMQTFLQRAQHLNGI